MWKPEEIRQRAKDDFAEMWLDTSNLVSSKSIGFSLKRARGKPHPLEEMRQKARKVLISMGFEEMQNRVIIDDKQIYEQYGPEAYIILDRAYYLGGTSRPSITLTPQKKAKIALIVNDFDDFDDLAVILNEYKEGIINPDDFADQLASRLGILPEEATRLVSEVFTEFKKLKPKLTSVRFART